MFEWLIEFVYTVMDFFRRLGRAGISVHPFFLLQFAVLASIILVTVYLSYRRWVRVRILSGVAWAVERNLPLDSALAVMEPEAWNGFWGFRWLGWRRVVSGLRERIRRGDLFGGACRPWRRLFGERRLCALLEAERAGRLDVALRTTVRILREDERARHDSKIVLFYPLYMAIFAYFFVLIIAGILIFIVPEFQKVCDDIGSEMDRCATMMASFRAVSLIVIRYFWGLVLGFVLAILFALFWWPDAVQRGWLFWIPGIGTLAWLGAARNSCEVACALGGAGVPLRDLLRGFSEAVWYRSYRRMGHRWCEGVERGHDLAGLVSRERLLPPAAREFIVLGIRSGDLAAGFRRASSYLSGRIVFVQRVLAMLAAALLICACGLLIGWVAVSIIGTLADFNMMMVP